METQMGQWLIPPGKGQEKLQRRVYIWKVTESSLRGGRGKVEGIPGRELSRFKAKLSECSGNLDWLPWWTKSDIFSKCPQDIFTVFPQGAY